MLSKFLFLLSLFISTLFAVDGAVSVFVVDKKRHFISEELVVKVELKTTAFSITNAKIALENSNDFIVLAPKSAAYIQTQEIDDEDWQVVTYEYKIYPLHAGKITIKPFRVSFEASMGYGQPKEKFNLLSQALSFKVDAPKGVNKESFVLSTTAYEVESTLSPKNIKELKIGDGITFTITQGAQNVPDVLIQPVHLKKSKHFKIYKEEPKLHTTFENEHSQAKRIDRYTFVAFKEGNTTIEPLTFIWWDAKNHTLHKEHTPSYKFVILPLPKKEPLVHEEKSFTPFVIAGAALLVFLIVIYLSYPKLRAHKCERDRLYHESEEGRYKTLLNSQSNKELYRNFYIWLDSANIEVSRGGFKAVIDIQPSFKESLENVQKNLVDENIIFDKKTFLSELSILRKKIIQNKNKEALASTINPL